MEIYQLDPIGWFRWRSYGPSVLALAVYEPPTFMRKLFNKMAGWDYYPGKKSPDSW